MIFTKHGQFMANKNYFKVFTQHIPFLCKKSKD